MHLAARRIDGLTATEIAVFESIMCVNLFNSLESSQYCLFPCVSSLYLDIMDFHYVIIRKVNRDLHREAHALATHSQEKKFAG